LSLLAVAAAAAIMAVVGVVAACEKFWGFFLRLVRHTR
jgi:hypothetical protein